MDPPEVTAKMPVERDAHEYNMNHEHRGKAIIFNNKVNCYFLILTFQLNLADDSSLIAKQLKLIRKNYF